MSDMVPELDGSLDEVPESGDAAEGKTVPAARFDGLQRKLSQVLAENADLKSRLENKTSEADPKESNVTDSVPAEFMQQFNAMAEQVAEMQLERARAQAVAKYPKVAPLASMLVGSTAEEVMDAAKQVSEALESGASPKEVADDLKDQATETSPATAEATPAAPAVSGGAVEGPTEPDIDAELAEARRTKNWTEILRLKYKAQGIEV